VVGLIAFPAGPAIDASASERAGFYADHGAATAIQSALIHGVAPLVLAAVFLALPATRRVRTAVRIAGAVGVGLSLAQLTLGLWRSAIASTASANTVDDLVDAINRLDGLKMLAFAAMIAASTAAMSQHRRLTATAFATTAALVASAVGYLMLSTTLALAAFASLPLLLAWTAAFGTTIARKH
jgi:hypothetical protein